MDAKQRYEMWLGSDQVDDVTKQELVNIKDNEAAMLKDLLTGTETISTLTTAWPFKVKLEACSGKVLKFTY